MLMMALVLVNILIAIFSEGIICFWLIRKPNISYTAWVATVENRSKVSSKNLLHVIIEVRRLSIWTRITLSSRSLTHFPLHHSMHFSSWFASFGASFRFQLPLLFGQSSVVAINSFARAHQTHLLSSTYAATFSWPCSRACSRLKTQSQEW